MKQRDYQLKYQKNRKVPQEYKYIKDKRWRNKNKEKVKEYSRNRRALKSKSEGTITKEEWIALCNKYENICLCCKKKRKLTLDHVIPLSKGGTNLISNAQPLCKSCNSKKNIKTTDYRKL